MDKAYLIVRTEAPHAAFAKFCARNRHVGRLVAARAAHEVRALEPGSTPLHTWISLFPSRDAAQAAWTATDKALISSPKPPLALVAGAVPDEGYPDDFIPTRRNVDAGAWQPPTLMLIEGSAQDQPAMDKYRDIILPMMKQRGSYYIAFELGGGVKVLSGSWSEAIFAISRWPTEDAARGFWLDSVYQNRAVPLRLGHSKFGVVILEGERDDG
jgi:uncharacterized protein (DUF1330 family)